MRTSAGSGRMRGDGSCDSTIPDATSGRALRRANPAPGPSVRKTRRVTRFDRGATRGYRTHKWVECPHTRANPMATPMLDDRELVKMFRAGSAAAPPDLFDRYCERLMKLAKRRIGQRMTSRVDPEDVIQSAFRTFFVRVRNDQFTFHGENDLFKLLVRLTVHKTLRQVAFHRAAKRNPELEAGHGSVAHELLQQLAAAEPP